MDKFIKNYQINLKDNERSYKQNSKRQIERSEKIIKVKMEPVISLRTALASNSNLAAEFANSRGVSVADLKGSMLQEEILNTNYVKVENLITDNKIQATDLNVQKEKLEEMLKELEAEKALLESGEKTEFLSIIATIVQEISPATMPINPVAPRKALNVAIGFVLSFVLGVFVAFFKAYWNSELIG